ncbi:MAG: N-acetylmuramoyl-L-alanine amidase [Thermodesulfobacteriota bacterium]
MMSYPHKHKMFSLRRFAACLAALCLLIAPLPAQSAINKSDTASKYYQAKQYHQTLSDNKTLAAERQNWLAAITKFRNIYRADQSHRLAPSALFMMARLYHEMYGQFNNPMDLGESIAYYEDIVSLYSKDRLADDALLAIANIHLKDRQNRKKAARFFKRLLRLYPDGDMVPAATVALDKITGTSKQNATVLLSGNKKTRINTKTPVAVSPPSTAGKASLKPLRYWSSSNYTRVVIETNTPVKYRENLLKKTANAPRRLYIDLENCRIAPELQAPIPINDGLLKRVRSGQHSPDITRVVLDTVSLSDYKIFSLQNPFRIVIDLKGQKRDEEQAAPAPQTAKAPPAARAPSAQQPSHAPLRANAKIAVNPSIADSNKVVPSLAQQLGLGIKRIILDPGHGGKDSGARGKNGLLEKDIVLKIAKQLSRKLKERLGVEVILTRDSDVFIPLEERTAIANSKEGDLFISIHVNAAPTKKARGIETYILAQARSKNAMALAARENATTTSKMSDLQSILLDLIQNSKKSESIKLAEYVQDNMVDGLRPKYKIKNLGVKTAPFIVLIGAEMPAILTEIAFISNPTEAKWLRSNDYLGRVSDQLVVGISNYASELNLAYLGPM